jgi:hypothetical protein
MRVCWGSSPEASPELSRSVRPHARTAIERLSLQPFYARPERRAAEVMSVGGIHDRSSDTAAKTKILTTNPITLPHTRPTPPTLLLFRPDTQSFPLYSPPVQTTLHCNTRACTESPLPNHKRPSTHLTDRPQHLILIAVRYTGSYGYLTPLDIFLTRQDPLHRYVESLPTEEHYAYHRTPPGFSPQLPSTTSTPICLATAFPSQGHSRFCCSELQISERRSLHWPHLDTDRGRQQQ